MHSLASLNKLIDHYYKYFFRNELKLAVVLVSIYIVTGKDNTVLLYYLWLQTKMYSCCSGARCSSRTSPWPPRSCASRTPPHINYTLRVCCSWERERLFVCVCVWCEWERDREREGKKYLNICLVSNVLLILKLSFKKE